MRYDLTTIRWFINKYQMTGSIENLPQSEQPPTLKIIEKNALVNEVKRNWRAPLHEVVNTLSLNCSLTTVKKHYMKLKFALILPQKSLLYQKDMQ